ncbi:MAG: carbamoylphosphate synthase large subunit, partial [Clostridia bacterium]|nr:carbamoylphosphate synthase large subunit [Clostridia bacterium]
CGGFTPDMINFANSINVYKVWADMIAFGSSDLVPGERSFCAFAGRREGKNFVLSNEELAEKYRENLRMVERIPDALAGAMGNQMFVATFPTKKEMDKFYSDAVACK